MPPLNAVNGQLTVREQGEVHFLVAEELRIFL